MPQNNPTSLIRLNKFIAGHLAIGRRQADTLIESGQVSVNGEIPQLGRQINPTVDRIIVRGKPLNKQFDTFAYILLNKPVGYVCSRRQQGDTPTIYTLLPEKFQHLKPVGRLDKDSSGILLLTNDGDLAHQMTHPSFHKTKVYEVALDKPLQPLHHQMISDHGIDLSDGKSKLALNRLKEGDGKSWAVVMHEGRNRQIRRTFAALGYSVTKLHRTQFGPLTAGQLGKAQFQEVPKPE